VVFQQGELITFIANVADSQTPNEQLSYIWNSNLQGELPPATQNIEEDRVTLVLDSLMAGAHTITLYAEDPLRQASSDSVIISIEENELPEVAFIEPHNDAGLPHGSPVFIPPPSKPAIPSIRTAMAR
jgi:hypothetical protein